MVLILLLLGHGNPEFTATTSVDVIELNHYFDDNGDHILSQYVFYDREIGCHGVIDWRMANPPLNPPNRFGGFFQMTWHNDTHLMKVRAKSYREVWTQYDKEVFDRDRLPSESRRKLGGLRPFSETSSFLGP